MGRAYQNRKEPMAKTSDMKAKVYSRYRLIPRQPDCGQLLWLHTACHPPFSQMTSSRFFSGMQVTPPVLIVI